MHAPDDSRGDESPPPPAAAGEHPLRPGPQLRHGSSILLCLDVACLVMLQDAPLISLGDMMTRLFGNFLQKGKVPDSPKRKGPFWSIFLSVDWAGEVRGGRLGDEVTSQTQAIQSIASYE